MTVVAFFMGLGLGVCLYPIARLIDHYVDTRREDRRKFTHSGSGQRHG